MYLAEMEWSPSDATEAFLNTLKLCRNNKIRQCNNNPRKMVEPESKELISALAAGMNAQLILEVTPSVTPLTIALATAARQTKGRLICILPDSDEQPTIIEPSRLVIKESGLADFVDFVTGDPLELLQDYEKVDFALIDFRIEDYSRLLRRVKINSTRAVIVANNVGAGENGLGGNVIKGVVKDDQKVLVRSMKHLIGKGMEVITIIGSRDDKGLNQKRWDGGGERNRSYIGMNRRKSQWVRKVDEVSGEEYIFRVLL